MCPVRFRINADGVANKLFIRALPIYSRPEYLQEVVKRCPNHVQAPESGKCINQYLLCKSVSGLLSTYCASLQLD